MLAPGWKDKRADRPKETQQREDCIMKRKNLMAAALTTVLTAGPVLAFTHNALAAEKAADAKTQQEAGDKAELIRLSRDANLTMRDVRGARLALFDGMTDEAQTYLDAAVSRVAEALEEAEDYAVNKGDAADADLLVPFDASVAFAEVLDKAPADAKAQAEEATDANAAPPPAKHGQLARVNRDLMQGETAKAMDDLEVAQEDVLLSASVVPMKLAKAQIEKASSLMADGKYYEAGLALKRIEDAVLINTVVLAAPADNAGGDGEAS
jgi:hypothetical protein